MSRYTATLILLAGLGVLLSAAPARAQIDWRADTAWTQLYLKGENAFKEKKYSRAAGWLTQAVERAESFGELDERLTETLKLLLQVYRDGRREEDADAISQRLAAIAAARPETAVDRHTRQTAYIDELRSQSVERLNAADYGGAEERLRTALAVADSIQAFDRSVRADLLGMLGVTWAEMGDPASAERFLLLSLAYRLNDSNADSVIAATIMRLAEMQPRGSDKSAPFDDIVQAIRSGPGWQESNQVRESLWELLHTAGKQELAQDRLDEAQELLMAAHAQATRLGPEDERVGQSLDALGVVQWRSGKPATAEPLFRQSSAILMEALGKKNPLAAAPLIHLGRLAEATAQWALADTALSGAIEVLKRNKERGDTTLGTLQHDMAGIVDELGDADRAEKLHRDAIKTDEKLLGKEHPMIARDAYGLAQHYVRQGKQDKAERYFLQAIGIAEKVPGFDDSVLAVYLTGYAESLQAQARAAEAQQIWDRVATMSQESEAKTP